ncbi:MAG: Sua5/YciO/YrdC/YwlC family protein, partial [Bacteroidota bacterium]
MKEEIKNCVDVLRNGGTILYPTDTIWGIGCDASNARAVQKVYKIKKRMENKGLIVLLDRKERLPDYIGTVPGITLDLLESIKTPLTIVYPNARNLAKNIIAPDGTIAIRLVHFDFCYKLIRL